MKICVINLDRHPQRMVHMRGLLKGLGFERIVAVDGNTLEGEHTGCFIHERKGDVFKYLSRYEKACILSHVRALETFLAGPDNYCCVLEDDVLLGRDFPDFIGNESWIPAGVDLIKIETYQQPVALGRSSMACFSRALAPLLSTHLGTAGYIVSRRKAERIIAAAAAPNRAMDYLIFGTEMISKSGVVYQLVPALCIQISRAEGPPADSEMSSSIQFDRRKPIMLRVRAEVTRPFRQLNGLVKRVFNGGRQGEPLGKVAFE